MGERHALWPIIDDMLSRQEQDAKQKTTDNWYWGQVGGDVAAALYHIRRAIAGVDQTLADAAFLRAAALAVERRLTEFASLYEDEAGYGAATFHEVVFDLQKLIEPSNSER